MRLIHFGDGISPLVDTETDGEVAATCDEALPVKMQRKDWPDPLDEKE